MNKIEEIIEGYDILEFGGINQQYIKNQIINAMKEFGKLCIDAGKSNNFHILEGEETYKTFEDFLKEIENEDI